MRNAVRRGHRSPLAIFDWRSGPRRAAASGSLGTSRALGCSALALALLCTGCAEPAAQRDGNASIASTKIERAKAERLAHEQQIARAVPSLASISLTQPRPFTLRDSGQNGAMTFLRDVDFRIVNNLGFFIHQLSATLVPTQAGAPIVFDDPTSFEIDVHEGMVTLDDAKLTALFNTYIFGYRNAPLRKLAVSAGDGVIHLQGEMQRDGWVPFSLTGTLAVRDGSQLVFHPTGVRVSGINAQAVMRAANVKMADLLKVETPIARLAGDDLVMSVDKLMPPPRLKIRITALRVTPAGLDLTLDDGSHAGFALPANAPQQAMYIRGGDVKFMRSMPMNADILIGPVDPAKRDQNFVFDLYHYRDQVSAGYFNFDERGAMAIRMPSYAGPASGAPLGNAAARLNDSFLAAQQNVLRDSRQHWEAFALAASAPQPGMQKVAIRRTPTTPFNERHVSNRNPTIHLHNVDFNLSGDIGFHVEDLDVQMIAKRPGEPVDLDDPNQYDIRILGGTVVESWKAMSALFNNYLLDYSPRSLNDLQLSADGQDLRVQGGIKLWNHVPGVWLPTDMKGSLSVLDDRHLAFKPSQVSVLGIPQAQLLRSLGIELASLTPLQRRGAELRGDALVLDQYTVFPPPILNGKLGHATVERDGLRLTFRRAADVPVPKQPQIDASSYMWMEGGDMKMFNVLELNVRALIRNSAEAGPMRFDLYGYRSQVAQGSVRMLPDGTLVVDMGKPNPLAAR
ncbi:lipoprotein [Burkholderia sp. A9]|uniref:lipoprotein n=1 Tax=Burkholderia sp. A9 TaxID=1365108 RepID=UPI000575BCD9|nr:lipoprotein [Burkholderia sp. A9]KHK59875.1 lipoprotein [Burkholderia sp. A9]